MEEKELVILSVDRERVKKSNGYLKNKVGKLAMF